MRADGVESSFALTGCCSCCVLYLAATRSVCSSRSRTSHLFRRPLIATALVFMFAAAACELALPHFVAKTIFTLAQAQGAANFTGHLPYVKALAACTLGFATCAAVRGTLFSMINNRMTQRLRTRLFGTLVKKEASFFDAQGVACGFAKRRAFHDAVWLVLGRVFPLPALCSASCRGALFTAFVLLPLAAGISRYGLTRAVGSTSPLIQ